jgi:hypothetical protein
MVEPFKEN